MTEMYEVLCLEVGDTVMLKGDAYHVSDIESAGRDASTLLLVDEDGFRHSVTLMDTHKVRVVVNEYVEVD